MAPVTFCPAISPQVGVWAWAVQVYSLIRLQGIVHYFTCSVVKKGGVYACTDLHEPVLALAVIRLTCRGASSVGRGRNYLFRAVASRPVRAVACGVDIATHADVVHEFLQDDMMIL